MDMINLYVIAVWLIMMSLLGLLNIVLKSKNRKYYREYEASNIRLSRLMQEVKEMSEG